MVSFKIPLLCKLKAFAILTKHLSHTVAFILCSLKCNSETSMNFFFFLHKLMDRILVHLSNFRFDYFLIKYSIFTFLLKECIMVSFRHTGIASIFTLGAGAFIK